MPFSDDDLALVRNALFAYGPANADTRQGMRAQELYRLRVLLGTGAIAATAQSFAASESRC